jgi:predicted acyltransferase
MKQTGSFVALGAGQRIASVDVVRGLTILVMIFVNDLAGVHGAPAWMKHVQPPHADGMTFVDVVFPAFLFIVGISIPFAIGGRLERGQSLLRIWAHILVRTLGLLIIGVFMVNEESMSEPALLSKPQWTLLMYLAVILVWSVLPGALGSRLMVRWLARFLGVALLAMLAVLYRGNSHTGLIEMRPQWWGILGLIGWAYLVGCTVYLLLRTQLAGVVGAIALLYCVYIADAAGAFSGMSWLTNWVSVGAALGSHGAITVSGVALGMMLTQSSPGTPAARMRWAFWFGVGLATAAWLLHSAHGVHRMFIINKIFATPPWCLWCSAITLWIWMVLYWLIDVRNNRRWAAPWEFAGQNALLAYILAPILTTLFEILAATLRVTNYYAELGNDVGSGLARSLIFAVAVTLMAGLLRRGGIVLRL